MHVKKHSGELVPFEPQSLKQSLSKSGASADLVESVYASIQDKIYDGISTKELYKLAFHFLKQQRNSYAARYSLKKALRDLGPEGFYFEKWVSALFRENGFQTHTGETVQGHAVTHEIDVIAVKEQMMYAIECKFRNDIDAKTTVTTPMYFLSRFKDISDLSYPYFKADRSFTAGALVTNAYFTKDAISFGEFYGINLLGWDYPEEWSIKRRVDNAALYPITCLTTLTKQEKDKLLKTQCILVKDLLKHQQFLAEIPLTEQRKKKILKEARELVKEQIIAE